MKQIRVSTVVTLILLITALGFAVVGFLNAPNSRVSPTMITIFMMISSAMFAILAVRGLSRKEMWQRFLGVVAVTAAVYMVVFAILFFSVLSKIIMP
jgi:Mg2+/citrate symporter